MKNVQFEGQTKGKLGNPEAKPAVEAATIEGIDALSRNKKLASTFDVFSRVLSYSSLSLLICITKIDYNIS